MNKYENCLDELKEVYDKVKTKIEPMAFLVGVNAYSMIKRICTTETSSILNVYFGIPVYLSKLIDRDTVMYSSEEEIKKYIKFEKEFEKKRL